MSSAVSINLIMFGLGAPFAAALHDRFGVRRVTVTALLVVAAASAATTLISAPWQLRLLWGVVIGTATGAVSIPWPRSSATAGLSAVAAWSRAS